MRVTEFNRTYRGVNITYSTSVGYRVPWSAYLVDRFVYADTLAGIKQLIREGQES